jgi:hypothetical protein
MELNIVSLLYLFFRLAPFIVVCYFSLSSIFNQDMKGLIYLVGLLLTCFVTFLLGQSVPLAYTFGVNPNVPTERREITNGVCNMITIGKDGSFSNIPLGIAILSYTFFYLVYIIQKMNIASANIPTLFFFPALILGDLIWNVRNECYAPFGLIISMVIGIIFGFLWAYIVDNFNQPKLFFLNVGGNQSVCQRPSKQLFKCHFPKGSPA